MVAQIVADDHAARPDERWAAWCRIASARMLRDDYAAVAAALERAVQELPGSADTYRSLGAVYDLKLSKPQEALAAYRKFIELGGRDGEVDERIRDLSDRVGGGSLP